MTNRERLERAGWKFIVRKQIGHGQTACLYEDPETGRLKTQSEALEIEIQRRYLRAVAKP